MKINLISVLFISSFLSYDSVFSKEIKVKTTSGLVKGKTIEIFNQTIEQFLGIPYAKPPIGNLRFAKPKPIDKPLPGIIDGTQPKHACMQPLDVPEPNQSEDCLVLNLWSKTSNNASNLKPVMFYIYGGGFVCGTINDDLYNGSALAAHDVVVVTANYRVGAFGYLFGGDETAPGNVALYDQNLALQWVRDNIHLFGGDKNQITLFGHSSGSICISMHVLSPISKGLFERAIVDGGAITWNRDRPPLNKEEALKVAKRLAKKVNCNDDNQWLSCLRKVSATDIIKNHKSVTEIDYPTAGTEFLPLLPIEAFEQGQFNKDLDLLVGATRDEGPRLAFSYGHDIIIKDNLNKKDFVKLVERFNDQLHNIDVDNATKFYLDKIDPNNSEAILARSFDFVGDVLIKCPAYTFAKRYAKHSTDRNRVFFYQLTKAPETSQKMCCLQVFPPKLAKHMGVYHGAELYFVFGYPITHPKSRTDATKTDIEFSKQVMKIWTDFAKYGNPGKNWKPLVTGLKEIPYLIKDLKPNHSNEYFLGFDKTCDGFWKNYF